MKALENSLLDDSDDHMFPIAVLSGAGGIGKSALAAHFATVHRERFPDGVIGLSVDGRDNDTIAREFARSAGEIIDANDDRDASSIMQSVFGDREILLIFDNAEQASLRQLFPWGRSRVIVTTRDRRLSASLEVPVSARVDVAELTEKCGVELLRKRLAKRVDAEMDAARQIVRLLGGLPLALQMIASHLELARSLSLESLLRILSDERNEQSTLEFSGDPHLSVRVSFNASLKFLKEDEIDFFACLSVCAVDSFSLRSAAAAGGCAENIAVKRLDYLYRLSLVKLPEAANGTRFAFHPLLRLFAAELCGKRKLAMAARERHARYFISLAKSIEVDDRNAALSIADDMDEMLNAAGWLLSQKIADLPYLVRLEPLLYRFGRWREAAELMARFLLVAETRGDTEISVQIRIYQAKFLQLLGQFQEAAAVLEPVAVALTGVSSASLHVQGMYHNAYADVLQHLGKFQEAADALERSKAIYEQLSDERSLAMVLNSLGGVLQRLGEFQEAAEALERSKAISEQLGDERSLAMVLNSLGGVLQRLGKFHEAADALQRSHDLLAQQGDERGQAMVLNSLGGVLQRLGRFHEAADALQRSHDLLAQQGDERGQAMVLNSLGGVLQRLGKFQEVADALTKAADIEQRLGSQRGQAMVLNSLGGVLQRLGRFQEAADALERSKAISEQLGDERSLAMVLNSLGGVLQRLGRFQEADRAFTSSVAIGLKLNDSMHLAKVHTAFGKTLVTRGDVAAGIDHLRQGFQLDEDTKSRIGMTIVAPLLVDALREQGQHEEADAFLKRAIAVAPSERSIERLVPAGHGPSSLTPGTRLTGKIKRLLEPMGRPRYGFFTSDLDGEDIYFSERQIGAAVFSTLSIGLAIEANVVLTSDGRRQARTIRLQT
ncbi:MAG: hypothetical protein QOI12_5220 [Alphaproteobacteria bacterium]|nr:hypothetical protein [Alphaproteobacteria bacterium]